MSDAGVPDGDVYDWYQRGLQLLANRDPAAAATILARAQYDAGRYAEAVGTFRELTVRNPADDYAQFGLGLAASRAGDLDLAAEHLALAVAMRPDLGHYSRALRGVRARRGGETS